ncbi:hypothetical protein V2G26_009467 [Clonostachys chloroleuca]
MRRPKTCEAMRVMPRAAATGKINSRSGTTSIVVRFIPWCGPAGNTERRQPEKEPRHPGRNRWHPMIPIQLDEGSRSSGAMTSDFLFAIISREGAMCSSAHF